MFDKTGGPLSNDNSSAKLTANSTAIRALVICFMASAQCLFK